MKTCSAPVIAHQKERTNPILSRDSIAPSLVTAAAIRILQPALRCCSYHPAIAKSDSANRHVRDVDEIRAGDCYSRSTGEESARGTDTGETERLIRCCRIGT